MSDRDKEETSKLLDNDQVSQHSEEEKQKVVEAEEDYDVVEEDEEHDEDEDETNSSNNEYEESDDEIDQLQKNLKAKRKAEKNKNNRSENKNDAKSINQEENQVGSLLKNGRPKPKRPLIDNFKPIKYKKTKKMTKIFKKFKTYKDQKTFNFDLNGIDRGHSKNMATVKEVVNAKENQWIEFFEKDRHYTPVLGLEKTAQLQRSQQAKKLMTDFAREIKKRLPDPIPHKNIASNLDFFEDMQNDHTFYSEKGCKIIQQDSPEITMLQEKTWYIYKNNLYNLEYKNQGSKLNSEPIIERKKDYISKNYKKGQVKIIQFTKVVKRYLQSLNIPEEEHKSFIERQIERNEINQNNDDFNEVDVSLELVTNSKINEIYVKLDENIMRKVQNQLQKIYPQSIVMRVYSMPSLQLIREIDLNAVINVENLNIIVLDENRFVLIDDGVVQINEYNPKTQQTNAISLLNTERPHDKRRTGYDKYNGGDNDFYYDDDSDKPKQNNEDESKEKELRYLIGNSSVLTCAYNRRLDEYLIFTTDLLIKVNKVSNFVAASKYKFNEELDQNSITFAYLLSENYVLCKQDQYRKQHFFLYDIIQEQFIKTFDSECYKAFDSFRLNLGSFVQYNKEQMELTFHVFDQEYKQVTRCLQNHTGSELLSSYFDSIYKEGVTDNPLEIMISFTRKIPELNDKGQKKRMPLLNQTYAIDFSNDHKPIVTYEKQEFSKVLKIQFYKNNSNFMLFYNEKLKIMQNFYLGDIITSEIQHDFNEQFTNLSNKLSSQNIIPKDKPIKFMTDKIDIVHDVFAEKCYKQKQICQRLQKVSYNYIEEQSQLFNPSECGYHFLKINDFFQWDFKVENNSIIFEKRNLRFINDQLKSFEYQAKLTFQHFGLIHQVEIQSDLKLMIIVDQDRRGFVFKLGYDNQRQIDQNIYDLIILGKILKIISISQNIITLIRFDQNQQQNSKILLEQYCISNKGGKSIILLKRLNLGLYDTYINQIIETLQLIFISQNQAQPKLNLQNVNSQLEQEVVATERDLAKFFVNSLIYKKYLFIQQQDHYLLFEHKDLKYIGSYEFTDIKIKKIFVFDDQVYVLSDLNTHVQLYDGLFETLERLNPMGLHCMVDLINNQFTFYDHEQIVVNKILINQFDAFMNQHQEMPNLNTDQKIFDYIDKMNLAELTSYLGSNYQKQYDGTFLHWAVGQKSQVIDCIIQKIKIMNPQQIPVLFLYNIAKKTPFDLAWETSDDLTLISLLEMAVRFQNETYYNYCIDSHLVYFLQKGIDLIEYMGSNLPMQKIKSQNYPAYSHDESNMIHADFDQNFGVSQIYSNYDAIFKNHLIEDESNAQVQVEYYIVNIPQSMKTYEFIKQLGSQKSLQMFELLITQTILDFKWERYARSYFYQQFFYFLIFLASYIIDIYFLALKVNRELYIQLILKLVCASYLILTAFQEVKQLRKLGAKEYVPNIWNFFDIAMILLYFSIIVLDIGDFIQNYIIILHSAMLMLVLIKLLQNLRIFQGFSFLVSMLQAVFLDLRYFILLYSFVIALYGLIFSMLHISTNEEENDLYKGMNYSKYFIMAFRASIGDFQTGTFNELDNINVKYAWIIWISGVLFLNIILLNFIIAVISESYEKVMQRMVAESYKVKAQLIRERELHFTEDEFKNNFYLFPRYLILRRPVINNEAEEIDWQGYVKDIKKGINKMVNIQLTKSLEKLSMIEEKNKTIMKAIKQVNNQYQGLASKSSVQTEIFKEIKFEVLGEDVEEQQVEEEEQEQTEEEQQEEEDGEEVDEEAQEEVEEEEQVEDADQEQVEEQQDEDKQDGDQLDEDQQEQVVEAAKQSQRDQDQNSDNSDFGNNDNSN
eukprot:403377162